MDIFIHIDLLQSKLLSERYYMFFLYNYKKCCIPENSDFALNLVVFFIPKDEEEEDGEILIDTH